MPGPDGGRIERGVADEPGIGQSFTGAGLARLPLATHVRVAGAGAAGDHAFEHLRDVVGLAGSEHALALACTRLVDLSTGEDDPAYCGRVVMDAAVGERGVGVRLLERGDADAEAADRVGGRDVAMRAELAGDVAWALDPER